MKRKLSLVGMVVAILTTSGCAMFAPYDMSLSAVQELELASEKPPKPTSNRLIITGFKDSHGLSGVSVSQQAAASLRRGLQKKGANIVNINDSMRNKLEEEFKKCEISDCVSDYQIPEAASLALDGEITSISVSTLFSEGYKKEDGTRVPPSCMYSATVQGGLSMYSVTPLKKVAYVDISAKDTIIDRGARACRNVTPQSLPNQVNAAAVAAVETAIVKVMNNNAPEGYIKGARLDTVKGKDLYVELSITPEQGAIPGTKVQFLKEFKGRYIEGFTAKVAKTNDPTVAYVKLSKPEQIAAVKAHGRVKLLFGGFWQAAMDAAKQAGM